MQQRAGEVELDGRAEHGQPDDQRGGPEPRLDEDVRLHGGRVGLVRDLYGFSYIWVLGIWLFARFDIILVFTFWFFVFLGVYLII